MLQESEKIWKKFRPHSVNKPSIWVSTTYFAEGLPYMLVRYLTGVYFTDIGIKETYLGFLNFLGLPWNFKFLWAPAVDLFGTKRGWLVKIEVIITLCVFVIGFLTLFGPSVSGGSKTEQEGMAAIIAIISIIIPLAFISATHDISIDAYYMEAITNPAEQAAYTGLRVMTYRLAIIFTKSVLVALASWFAWIHAFLCGGLCMGLLLLFHAGYLPRIEKQMEYQKRKSGETAKDFCNAFLSYLDQEKIGIVLLFIVTYKLGDEILFSMNTPFLLRELKLEKDQLSWVAGVFGTASSIAGSLVSAYALKKYGFRKAVWPLTLAMNLNIWVYIWLAWALPDPATTSGIATIALVHAYEQFAAGLGNAVLIVYIMRTCRPEFKAAHYAVASAITSIGGTLIGGFGGFLVESMGYVNLYLLAFTAAIPSMICLFFLPLKEKSQ
jgi:PAT family beta-lactamase induction signal transducer AmpG